MELHKIASVVISAALIFSLSSAYANRITIQNKTDSPISLIVYGLKCMQGGRCYVNKSDSARIRLPARGSGSVSIRSRCIGSLNWASTNYRRGYMSPHMHQRGPLFAAHRGIKIHSIRGYRGIHSLLITGRYARTGSGSLIPCR